MAGISSKAMNGIIANRFKFNAGSELEQNEFEEGSGLDWYDTEFRKYDPQVGRFWQIDGLSDLFENHSPYNYTENNPILFNDPTGLSKQGYGFEEDQKTDESLENVVVTPQPKNNISTFLISIMESIGNMVKLYHFLKKYYSYGRRFRIFITNRVKDNNH